MGQTHIRTLAGIPNVQVIVVADPNLEAAFGGLEVGVGDDDHLDVRDTGQCADVGLAHPAGAEDGDADLAWVLDLECAHGFTSGSTFLGRSRPYLAGELECHACLLYTSDAADE